MQLGLAGAAQLIVIIRTCTEKGQTTTARTYFVTSRPADLLSPLQILFLRRGQWGIQEFTPVRTRSILESTARLPRR